MVSKGCDLSYVMGRYEEMRTIYSARNVRMEQIERQYKLMRPRAMPGFTPIPSNITRTTVDLVTAMLSGANSLRIHVPVLDDNESSKILANKCEVFLRSAYERFDETLFGRMQDPSLQRVLAQQISYRGWVSVQVILEEGTKNPFQVVAYDPYQSYGACADGLYEFFNRTKMRWGDVWNEMSHLAKERGFEYGKYGPKTEVEVINYWVRDDDGDVHNLVIVEGEIIKEQHHEEFDEIPVIFGPAGGLNTKTGLQDLSGIWDPTDPYQLGMYDGGWEATAGLSAADGVAPYQAISSIQMSMMMSAFEKWLHPPKFVTTFNGTPRAISFRPDATNWMMMNAQGQREQVDSFRPQGAMPEMVPLLQQMDGMMQRGSAPYTLFGQMTGDNSQASISEAAITGASYIAGPKADILKHVYRRLNNMLLCQYRKFVYPLSGMTYTEYDKGGRPGQTYASSLHPRELRMGKALPGSALGMISEAPADPLGYSGPQPAEMPIPGVPAGAPVGEGGGYAGVGATDEDDLMPGEVPARYKTVVTIKLHLPKDMLQRANTANMLRSSQAGPSASLYYVQEEILEVEDSELESVRLTREKIEMDPEFQMAKAYNDYVKKAEDGDKEAAVFAQILARRLKIEDLHATVALNVAGQQAMQTGAGMGPGGGPAGQAPGGGGGSPPRQPGQASGPGMGTGGGEMLPPGVPSPAAPGAPAGGAIAPGEAGQRPGGGGPMSDAEQAQRMLEGMGVPSGR